jgi:hypothetical protein
MRQKMVTAVLGTILLGAAAGQAQAQYRDRDYGYGGYGGGYGRGDNVIARVMSDVQRVGRGPYGGSDRNVQRAMDELSRFDEKWRRGQWDQGRLDRAIERVSALANSRAVNPRDRQMLFQDANLLRNFRATRGGYGGRPGGPYGYPPYSR